jgi:hypothetical protein
MRVSEGIEVAFIPNHNNRQQIRCTTIARAAVLPISG